MLASWMRTVNTTINIDDVCIPQTQNSNVIQIRHSYLYPTLTPLLAACTENVGAYELISLLEDYVVMSLILWDSG
jgi:hypothetical protein